MSLPYETISFSHGGWQAQVCPALGGNLVRLDYQGAPVLRPLTGPQQLAADPYTIGSPILLPANRTLAGQFTFQNTVYRLPVNEPQHNAHLHGLVYTAPFALLRQTAAGAVLALENQGRYYPFPFLLEVEYRLDGQGAHAFYRICNTGSGAMPLTFGLHTTFAEPDWFRVPLAGAQEKDEHHIPTGRTRPLNEEEARYCTGSPSRGQVISGYYLSGGDTACIGPRLRYQAGPGFDHWVLYNARGQGGLLCVEPQCGAVNGLNLPGGCRVLAAGETLQLKTRIYFEETPGDPPSGAPQGAAGA